MRGNRGPRGRAGKIEGINYTGDPAGVLAPWGGGPGASSPTIDQFPTITLVIDEDDDGSKIMDRVDAGSRAERRSTRDSTKVRLRWSQMSLANWVAWLMGFARGTRSFKTLVVDGIGGADVAGAPGSVQAKSMVVNALGVAAIDPGAGHIMVRGAAPTVLVQSGFLGAGTGAVVSISGNDTLGTVNIKVGTGPAGSSSLVLFVVPAVPMPSLTNVSLAPANAAAAALSGPTQVFAMPASIGGSSPLSGWAITAGSAPLTAGAFYSWIYFALSSSN